MRDVYGISPLRVRVPTLLNSLRQGHFFPIPLMWPPEINKRRTVHVHVHRSNCNHGYMHMKSKVSSIATDESHYSIICHITRTTSAEIYATGSTSSYYIIVRQCSSIVWRCWKVPVLYSYCTRNHHMYDISFPHTTPGRIKTELSLNSRGGP